MTDNQIRNREGYLDPTAYQAIRNVEAEARRKGGLNMAQEGTVKAGEIWTRYNMSGEEKESLVISNRGNYVVTLNLYDSSCTWDNDEIVVASTRTMFACAGKLNYARPGDFVTFKKILPKKELEEIKGDIADCLGLGRYRPAEPPELLDEPAEEKAEERGDNCRDLVCEELRNEIDRLALELAMTETERNLYKDMLYAAVPALEGKE